MSDNFAGVEEFIALGVFKQGRVRAMSLGQLALESTRPLPHLSLTSEIISQAINVT
jgi:hypothetical protein